MQLPVGLSSSSRLVSFSGVFSPEPPISNRMLSLLILVTVTSLCIPSKADQLCRYHVILFKCIKVATVLKIIIPGTV